MKKVSVVGRWPLAVGRWPLAVGRWPLAVGLTCAWLGVSTRSAEAGSWRRIIPTYPLEQAEPGNEAYNQWSQIAQGTTSSVKSKEYDWIPDYFHLDDYYNDGYTIRIENSAYGESGSVQQEGRFGSRWRWVPAQIWDAESGRYVDDPNDEVPAQVFFRVTARGHAFASTWLDEGTDGSDQNVEVTLMGVDFPSYHPRDGAIAAVGEKTKTVVKNTNGETEITAPWASVFVKAWVGGDRYNSNSEALESDVKAFASGDSVPTNRGVAISSSIDQSFRKSTTQPRTEPGQLPLAPIPGSDPPVWKEPVPNGEPVHSAAFWEEAGDAGWRGAATYHANTLGFNHPTYLWTLTGGTPGIGTLFDVPNGPISIFDAIDLGGSRSGEGMTTESTLKVFVQDQDGTTESNDYIVNWHLPEDDWEANGDEWTIFQPYEAIAGTVVPEGRALRNGTSTGTFRWNKYSYADHAIAEAVNLVFQPASNAPSSGTFAAFLTALGLSYEEWFAPPDNETHSVTFSDAWNDACNNPNLGSTFLGLRPPVGMENDVDIQNNYRMVNPKIVVEYRCKPKKGDKYDAQGYNGIVYRVGQTFEGSHMGADFERND